MRTLRLTGAAAAAIVLVLCRPALAGATVAGAGADGQAAEGPAADAALASAAVGALRWAFYAPNGYRWEYGGILVLHDGQIMHNAFPRTLHRVDAVPMDAEQQLNPGDTLLGLYHTHPCKSKEYFSQYYSPQDLISAFYYHVPSFILDECSGDVHEFDPAADAARSSGAVVTIRRAGGGSRQVHLPSGRIVGNIGDRGPDLSAIEALVGRTLYR